MRCTDVLGHIENSDQQKESAVDLSHNILVVLRCKGSKKDRLATRFFDTLRLRLRRADLGYIVVSFDFPLRRHVCLTGAVRREASMQHDDLKLLPKDAVPAESSSAPEEIQCHATTAVLRDGMAW
jgi:hypothetical protein